MPTINVYLTNEQWEFVKDAPSTKVQNAINLLMLKQEEETKKLER